MTFTIFENTEFFAKFSMVCCVVLVRTTPARTYAPTTKGTTRNKAFASSKSPKGCIYDCLGYRMNTKV